MMMQKSSTNDIENARHALAKAVHHSKTAIAAVG